MKTVALILSGCGVFDGSEIHETVCTMLALDRVGVKYHCFAPNMNQTQVVNHLTKEPMKETRNVLVEAARIARGQIEDIKTADIHTIDAAIYPGGFGAASNLSNFAEKGAECTIQPDILAFAKAMAGAGKPQGFICIAPTMISKIYGKGIEHTIGSDKNTADKITSMGGKHIECPVNQTVIDYQHKVVSTPAYMLASHIKEVADGTEQLVQAIISLLE